MKKTFYIIISVIMLFGLICVIIGCDSVENPELEKRIAELDPDEITACYIEWGDCGSDYRLEITDAEQLNMLFEAVTHMEFRKVKYERKMGGLYLIWFVENGEEKYIFTFEQGGYISISQEEYAAKITNMDDIHDTYGWGNFIRAAQDMALG